MLSPHNSHHFTSAIANDFDICTVSTPLLPPLLTSDVSTQTDMMSGCLKQAAVFNLQTVYLVLWSRTIPAYITSLQPGIGSSHTKASVSARGHNGAQSGPQSAQWWEFMLSVRCQVQLFQALKKNLLFVKALFIVTPHFLP